MEKRTVNLNEKWTCQLRFRSGFEIRRRAVTLAIRKQRQAVQGDLSYQITKTWQSVSENEKMFPSWLSGTYLYVEEVAESEFLKLAETYTII